MSLDFQTVRGASFQRDLQAADYTGKPMVGVYTDADTPGGKLWPKGGTPEASLSVVPTVTWLDSANGIFRVYLSAATTGSIPPGDYELFAYATRGADVADLALVDLTVHGAGAPLSAPAQSPVTGLPTSATLSLVSTLWCRDEDIAVRCGPDFTTLLPDSQMLAWGSDGTFDPTDPWTLTSASSNFTTQLPAIWPQASTTAGGTVKITPSVVGYVVWLRKPSSAFPAGGHLFGVAAVNGSSLTLRRLGMPANLGQAPAPAAGLTGVEFQVATFAPQVEEATYDTNQRFQIDANLPYRTPSNMYDIRPLRRACVAQVLLDRYSDESRAGAGDFAHKVELIKQELSDLRAKLLLRWGTGLESTPQTNWFSTRIVR